ncbi:hypothetical protein [Paludibaculum fermentans]|uniref:Uncharacterized protein n=1 Tax=Paludibaculum fermentans TaxID=1473598 RepID=A0A7S7NVY9_PALFE|nr:hypothetical protein [Paludibaculum fermentans]QOY90784.1 hypothetical protein IRI77_12805 [Paludibaculum fermentans]
MSFFSTVIVSMSSLLLAIRLIWRHRREPSVFALSIGLGMISLYLLLLHVLFGFPAAQEVQAKSGSDYGFLTMVLALYICMLLGMMAEYGYHHFSLPVGSRQRFDFGSIARPILVSPLVFIPLVSSIQNSGLDLVHMDGMRFMVFVVAFENGFLWRGYSGVALSRFGPKPPTGG